MGFGVFSMIPMGPFTLALSIYHLPVLSYTDKRVTYPTLSACGRYVIAHIIYLASIFANEAISFAN
jgi:hypothetical protein